MTSEDKLNLVGVALILLFVGLHVLALTIEPSVDDAIALKKSVEKLEHP